MIALGLLLLALVVIVPVMVITRDWKPAPRAFPLTAEKRVALRCALIAARDTDADDTVEAA